MPEIAYDTSEYQNLYSIEKRVIASFLTDTAFCHEIFPILDYEYFSNIYAAKIISWVEEYFKTYGKAPKSEIESIFLRKSDSLSDDLREVIEEQLEFLSEIIQDSKFDTAHSVDLAREYFTGRILHLKANEVLDLLEQGNTQQAKEVIQSFQDIKDMESGVDNSFNNKDLVDNTIEKIWYPEDSKDTVLRLIGRIGDYFGDWERGWLIAIMASMKRGKTWSLMLCAMDAVIQRKKAVFVSLEMPDKDMNRRAVPTVTGMKNSSKEKLLIPIFDCLKNQKGTCEKIERSKNTEAIGSPNEPEDYYDYRTHKICVACRGTRDFSPSVWYKEIDNNASPGKMRSIMNSWNDPFNNYLRTKSFSADSVTSNSFEGVLDQYIKLEGFDAEILIVDYADLSKAKDSKLEYRHRLDAIWKDLKALAHKRNILVITASQSNRDGMKQNSLDSTHAAEDIRKIAIVDAFYTINQTKEEKRKGIARIGFADARHNSQFNECFVLQDFSRGQFCLDSEFIE